MKNEIRTFRNFDDTDVICKINRKGGQERVVTKYSNGHKHFFPFCDRVHFTPWGFVEIDQDGFYPRDMVRDFDWFAEFDGCSVFEEDGLLGLVRNGKVIFPAVLNQIERVDGRLFLRRGEAYSLLGNCGSTVYARFKDDDFYVENGRMGWMRNGKVIIQAQYDKIEKWYNYDVFRCKTGNGYLFLNSAGEEILYDDNQDWNAVGGGFSGSDCFMMVQPVEKPDGGSFGYEDGYVKGEVLSTSSLNSMMTEGNGQIRCSEKDLDILNSDYTWDFASFKATSRGDGAVSDCLRQISALPAFNSTWHYLLKIWTAPGLSLTAEDLREIRYKFEDEGRHILSMRMSASTDPLLKEGEVNMILTRFYSEGGFPSHCLFHLFDVLSNSTLEEIQKETEKLKAEIRNEMKPEEAEKEIEAMFHGIIEEVSLHCKRPWKESLRVMEHFKDIDPRWRTSLGKVFCGWIFTSPFSFTAKEAAFDLRKVKWMLDNGVLVNNLYDGNTFLGHLERRLQEEKDPKADVSRLSENKLKTILDLRDTLLNYGAKTKAQIRAEEAGVCEYDSEMNMLLAFCHQEKHDDEQ